MMRAAVTYLDAAGHSWLEGTASIVDGRIRISPDAPAQDLPRLDGVVTGGFTDHHVHLQLIDPLPLAESVLGRVVDLGANPEALAAVHNSSTASFAGAFLTPPGGYPSDRDWAPADSVREIADTDAAARAVAEMADAGATRIKVISNSVAGPVFSDELFAKLVQIAASHDLSVTAHAEGEGEAQRVARLGAGTLAHAPFSERLSAQEIDEMRGHVAWISTLAIHDGETYDIALGNVRRFHAAGGTVLYGTDMGNGPTPVGLNSREITALRDAGIDGDDLLRSLTPSDPLDPGSRLIYFPGQSAQTADPLRARPLTLTDLED